MNARSTLSALITFAVSEIDDDISGISADMFQVMFILLVSGRRYPPWICNTGVNRFIRSRILFTVDILSYMAISVEAVAW